MPSDAYDIITVGGGLGGAALALAMARRGARVLVLEREREFSDRVRGEWLAPWGLEDAQALALADLLAAAGGHRLNGWDTHLGALLIGQRDLVETTPQALPALALFHPALQDALLRGAAEAGADVRRGVAVRGVVPGTPARVQLEDGGRAREIHARLVVGADGRASMVRQWAGFAVRRDAQNLFISGVLFENMAAPAEDRSHVCFNPTIGRAAYLFPQGGGRVRAYLVAPHRSEHRFNGIADLSRFLAQAADTTMAPHLYAGAHAAGPLATFSAADTWVDHPYRDGVVLIGDAAASSDPSFGQGLSLTLRDVRVLRDRLLADADWDAAAHAYAHEHDRHYGVIHAVNRLFAELFLATGPAADERRVRAFANLTQDPTLIPDHQLSGPDLPLAPNARERLFDA
jgi:2-polyprenyl-6-methoxyphenol hydroxylase-like FAD-dependent oxidoreductase